MLALIDNQYRFPEMDRAELEVLLARDVTSLEKAEWDRIRDLVGASLMEWRAHIAGRIQEQLQLKMFSQKALAETIGIHYTTIGKMLDDPGRVSENIIGRLSLAVTGFDDVYREFRARADAHYLPRDRAQDLSDLNFQRMIKLAGTTYERFMEAAEEFNRQTQAIEEDDQTREAGQ